MALIFSSTWRAAVLLANHASPSDMQKEGLNWCQVVGATYSPRRHTSVDCGGFTCLMHGGLVCHQRRAGIVAGSPHERGGERA